MLVVKYLDVGRRGQLGGGDKRADSCDRHEARQGSPPFNPAQDQLGRDDMVAGEDGLAQIFRETRRDTVLELAKVPVLQGMMRLVESP
ncbi:hypothetical protein [Mycobacterium sp.]|uniref:hypothetical protein n=1 Tax=Mycobacterium sp. TaxID=1785 RepID=UPI002CC932AB|nr:hypothetical protein [Mycobacterium sp.]HTH84035.1 hypothetical protein [Mycobacterium sp.]